MAYWLPYHEDRRYGCIQAAAQGQYKTRFSPVSEIPEAPSADVQTRAMDEFSHRADQAMARYQERKAMRGRMSV